MLELRDNVPKPKVKSGVKKYPFDGMKVGQMFFVKTEDFERTQGSIRSSARKYYKQGMRFSILRTTYKGERGIGVWRDE